MRVVPDAFVPLPLSPAAALQESEIHGKQLEDSSSSLRQKASEVYFYSIQYVSSVAGATLLQLFGTVKVHLSRIAHPDPLFPRLQVDVAVQDGHHKDLRIQELEEAETRVRVCLFCLLLCLWHARRLCMPVLPAT